MQKFLKTISLILTVIFMCIVSLTPVRAYNDSFDTFTSYNYKAIKRKAYTSNVGRKIGAKDHVNCFYNGGSWLYCIENGQELTHDSSFQKVDNVEAFLKQTIHHKTTAAQKQKWLSIVMAIVPRTYQGAITSQSEETYLRYCAASTIVWEIMDECRDASFHYIGAESGKIAPKDGNIYTTESIRSKFFEYYNEYVKAVEDFIKVPSFSSASIQDAPVYDMSYNRQTKQFEVLLQDQLGVLDNYELSGENCHFERNGQYVKITTTQRIENNQTLLLYLKDSQKHRESALVGFSASITDHQKLMCAGELLASKTRAYVKLKMDFGALELSKSDSFDALIQGAIFHLTNHQDIDFDVTVDNGKINVDLLKPGVYQLQEVKAPQGYLLDTNVYQVTIRKGETTKKVIVNHEPLGNIQLKKSIDAQMTNQLIGDAYLKDITYGLYAKEKISSAQGSHVYYVKDQLVQSAITNQEGIVIFKDLPMGQYYIKELKSNDSLLLNPTPIDVTLSYQNMYEHTIQVSTNTKDIVASRRIQVFKEGIKDGESGLVQGLKGAEFTFVLNQDFEKVGFAKAKKYFVGSTDEEGYLTTSLLPYGTYRVKETKTPQGYYGASDFLVTIDKDASCFDIAHQMKKVTVNNVPFESLLQIVKKDKTTNQVVKIAGATFKIKNLTTQEYVSYTDWSAFPNIHVSEWTTHQDGTITLNTKLKPGRYALEEIKAPHGYLLNKEPLTFEITEKDYDIAGDGKTPLTSISFYNEAVKGVIKLQKTGEVLVDYQKGQFVYQEKGLKDVVYGVYAGVDILSPSDASILFKKGEKVCEMTTDEAGYAQSPLLPLGSYECRELHTLDGFILNTQPQMIELSYVDENQSLVEQTLSQNNERERIKVKVCKKDEDTLEYVDGATLSLIANQDIYSAAGKLIVKQGTLLQSVTSSKDGYVTFDIDLPLHSGDASMYRIVETKQPDGYVNKDMSYELLGQYTHQQDQVYTFDFLNKKTITKILKIDQETLQSLSGALLQVIDPTTHEVIDEWESQSVAHVIEGLTLDKEYILHEVKAPEGYLKTSDLKFVMNAPEKMIQLTNEKEPVETLGDEPPVTLDNHNPTLFSLLLLSSFIIMMITKKKKVS